MKKKLFVLLLMLCTVNWMYLRDDKIKWGNAFNEFPIVKYKVNPEMIGFNTGDALSIIDAIRDAGNLWSFQKGESHFQLSYNGSTSSLPAGYDQMSCTEEGKKTMRELDNLVYASNEDSDCSGQACTFMWSCADKPEILHFDMQINARDFEWDTGTNHKKSYNLFTIVAHQFGQLLGLGHCETADNDEVCQAKIATQGTSNPQSDSLVYKFIDAEVIRTSMSADDKAGLQSIYGVLNSEEQTMKTEIQSFADKANSFCVGTCVSMNDEKNQYAVSNNERAAWSEYLAKRTASNLETKSAIRNLFLDFQNSYLRSLITGITAEEYMDESIRHQEDYITAMPTEFLDLYLQIIYVDILNRERALNSLKYELDTRYYSFLDSERKVLMQLRRRMIDEKAQR